MEFKTGYDWGTLPQSPIGGGVTTTNMPVQPDFWSWDGVLGNEATGTNGWGMPALNLANSAFGMWSGLEKLKLGKQQLAENQRQFNLNFGNQAQLTNTALRDRQTARYNRNPGVYESPDIYMSKHAVKEG